MNVGYESLRLCHVCESLRSMVPEPLVNAVWKVWEVGKEEAHFHPLLLGWEIGFETLFSQGPVIHIS